MTEKRFTWLKKGSYAPEILIEDSLTGKTLNTIDCYDLLNALYEENVMLKEENRKLNRFDKYFTEWSKDDGVKEIIIGDCKVILE